MKRRAVHLCCPLPAVTVVLVMISFTILSTTCRQVLPNQSFKALLDRKVEYLDAIENNFNASEFGMELHKYKKHYNLKHGDLGYTLKVVWQAALDLTWFS